MGPAHSSLSTDSRFAFRRRFLSGVAAAVGAATAGCTQFRSGDDQSGEGDTVEVIVSNDTSDVAHIAVRVEDDTGATLLDRVYELEPGHTDESAGVDTRPGTVTVFTRGGASASWEYAPDVEADCDGEDIGIRLTADGQIESWYGC